MDGLIDRFKDRVAEWAEHPLVRRYSGDTLWLTLARAYWVVCAFSVGIYVTRTLGPVKFGTLSYAIAFSGLIYVLSTLSVESFIVRDLVAHPEKRDRLMGNLFVFRAVCTGVMIVVATGIILGMDQPPQMKLLCALVTAGYGASVTQIPNVYFNAAVMNRYIAWAQIGGCTIHSTVRLCAALFNADLWVYATAESVVFCSMGLFSIAFYWKKVASPFKWNFDIREVAALVKPAIPLSLCGILYWVYARTDIIMLKHFYDDATVGFYTLATRFTENWFLLGGLLVSTFFPAIVSASKISLGAYEKQLHRLYFLVFWAMVAAAAVTTIFAHFVMALLYGVAYEPAAYALQLFVWTLPCTLVISVYGGWAVNENLIQSSAWARFAGVVLNLIFNFLLIPRYGMAGAALTSIFTLPVGFAAVLLCFRRGREHLLLIFKSLFTLPSFKLGEHPESK